MESLQQETDYKAKQVHARGGKKKDAVHFYIIHLIAMR